MVAKWPEKWTSLSTLREFQLRDRADDSVRGEGDLLLSEAAT